MESCIYEGMIRHTRHANPRRSFQYPLHMLYLDLDEIPSLFDDHFLWSARRPNVAWFRREDHYGDTSVPLSESIRTLATEGGANRPTGPIRLLTHLRYLGYCFNPVSFYYCWAPSGHALETVVAEVSNTPWNERHMYTIPGGTGGHLVHSTPKAFHVSPFLDMDLRYDWAFQSPGASLVVEVNVCRGTTPVLEATLALARRPINKSELRRLLLRRPAMTAEVVLSIYQEAFGLWRRGATFFNHPTPTSKNADHESDHRS